MTISIIIPVYNTEKYLATCIDSVISQSFTDFEVLLVDDGSTDRSGFICDEYAKKDSRIRVFHKENGGVSSARNLGLDYANGEWVYFVDSDDEVLPGGIQTLVDCISDDVDCVMGGYIEIDEEGHSKEIDERKTMRLSRKRSVITMYISYGLYYYYCGYLWIRLLRNKIIHDFQIRFNPTISIKEDTLFLMQYVCRSNGITRQTTTPVYKYCRRADSAMGQVMRGFNYKYVDSFHALVMMKHEVDALFPSFSSPVFVAKQALYSRYYGILNMMNESHVRDEELNHELSLILHDEIGSVFLFKVRRKIRKLLRFFKKCN